MLRKTFALQTLTFWLGCAFIAGMTAPVTATSEDDDDSDGAFHSLDSVDTGRTHSLDSVDDGRTHSLDSVDTGRSHNLDSVEAESSETPAAIAPPAPQALPAIEDGNWEAQAARAKAIIAAAEKRLTDANAAYGNMMARQYPTGDAKLAIVDERRDAEAGVNDAWAYYGQIKKRAAAAGRPL